MRYERGRGLRIDGKETVDRIPNTFAEPIFYDMKDEGIVGDVLNVMKGDALTDMDYSRMSDEQRKNCLALFTQCQGYNQYDWATVLYVATETCPELIYKALAEHERNQQDAIDKMRSVLGGM